MTQPQLPMYSRDMTLINHNVAFAKREGEVYYFHGQLPVFHHPENDYKSFRMFTSQLIDTGVAKQKEIVDAFGVSLISVKRNIKKYREEGIEGFFKPRRTRGASVLTEVVLEKLQEHLDEGISISGAAKMEKLKSDTVRKAVKDGRLKKNPTSDSGAN